MPTLLTRRYADALDYACSAHGAQTRKGTDITYIAHLVGVSSLVLDHLGTEDEAIAALLHDVIEDCGAEHAANVRARFGDTVADIVEACTDGDAESKAKANASPADEQLRLWRIRKQAYLDHLDSATASARLVSCCDKLHNARAIVGDLETIGSRVFDRFNAGRDGTLWYYEAIAASFLKHGTPPAAELNRTVRHLLAIAGTSP